VFLFSAKQNKNKTKTKQNKKKRLLPNWRVLFSFSFKSNRDCNNSENDNIIVELIMGKLHLVSS